VLLRPGRRHFVVHVPVVVRHGAGPAQRRIPADEIQVKPDKRCGDLNHPSRKHSGEALLPIIGDAGP
jgi:hypothetical protein